MNATMQWLWVLLLAMMPIAELRGAIPLALGAYDLDPMLAIPLIVAANFLPVPFILLFLRPIELFFRRWPFWDRLLTRIFEHTRNKTQKRIERWESVALILFVAIPLPVTGAWTGSLASYLFGLDFRKSLVFIFLGVCIAAVIVTAAVTAGIRWFV
jgi:uncharacterized membrane protein